MSDLHPHWQATEEEVVPVHGPRTTPMQQETVLADSVSRRPAALLGMGIVVLMGVAFFQGMSMLKGQAAGTTIRITASGFEPASISVAAGEAITWLSEEDVPNILQSLTLCGGDGSCLSTPTLFRGDTASYTIPLTVASGTYEYTSVTNIRKQGSITVSGGSAAAPVAVPTAPAPAPVAAPVAAPQPSAPANFSVDTAVAPSAAAATGDLPKNPYTVGSSQIHPYDPTGSFRNENLHSGAPIDDGKGKGKPTPTPPRQPSTGANTWLGVFMVSIGLMWMGTRRWGVENWEN